jgi:hypothetical protein
MTVKQIHNLLDTMSPERNDLTEKKGHNVAVTNLDNQTRYNNERKYSCIYSRKAPYRCLR